MYPKQQSSGFYGTEIGNIAGVGNVGGVNPLLKFFNKKGMQPYDERPDSNYPLYPTFEGNHLRRHPLLSPPSGSGKPPVYYDERLMPQAGNPFGPNFNMLLAQSSPGGQDIGNVGGMLGEAPGGMTGFSTLLESLQEQNMQNSQREKDRRSLEDYGRNLGNY